MNNRNPTIDLLLKGGRVLDPANHQDGIADVAITDGRILRTAAAIDPAEARHSIDVSGLLVTPGLLDLHMHAPLASLRSCPHREHESGPWRGSLVADHHFLSSGVTTGVDVGTAGADEIDHFRRTVIDGAITRILALVNIARPGMGDAEQVVAHLDAEAAAQAALAHRGIVVGIKTAHYWTSLPFDAEHPPWASVERAVEAGRLCGISIRTTVHSMLDAMSKCLAMGMPLSEVIHRSPPGARSARCPRRRRSGGRSWEDGAEADVAVLELQRGEFSFRDCGYARIDADRKLECVLTLRAGRIVYERDGRALPHWRDAPEPYWRLPELQVGPIERNWRARS